jgi:CBS domain-containing protein
MKCPACGAANIEGSDECDSCAAPLVNAAPPKKGLEKKILEGSVADLAPRQALTISAGQSASEALETMRRHKVGCLLVVEGGKLAGIVSESTLLKKLADPMAFGKTAAGDVMRSDGVVMRDDDSVADAFHQFAVSGHRHLAVRLSDGRMAVLSSRDLLSYLCK